MAVDPYSLCPCGSGKKVKFCCAELVDEIEKLQRMMQGNQTVACLSRIEQLETKHPGHAFLLRAKAALQCRLGQDEQAGETLDQLLGENATDAAALADKAALAARKGDVATAVATLQRALDICDGTLTASTLQALREVAEALVTHGEPCAAVAHLLLAVSANNEDQRVLGLLMQLNGAEHIPLFLKQYASLVPCPEDAPWKADFDAALHLFQKARLAASAEKFAELSLRADDSPAVWRNLATLRSWLADAPAAVKAFRKLSTLDVPVDDAAEAEAMAQWFDADAPSETIDVLNVEFPIKDIDALQSCLTADKRCVGVPLAPELTDAEGVRPRGVFMLLDRPMPATGVDLQMADVPNVQGELLLFGRQTDREARLELHIVDDGRVERATKALIELAGDALAESAAQHAAGQVSRMHHVLNWRWRLPADTPVDHVHTLVMAKRRQTLLEVWPDTPWQALGGKTPRQAAREPEMKIATLAAVFLLEQQMGRSSVDFDFNQVRAALELPEQGPIAPDDATSVRLPLTRMHRVEAADLSDDDLLKLFQQAQVFRAVAALRKLGGEVVGRPSLDDQLDKAEVYALLAGLEEDTSRSLELLLEARSTAERAGKSPARWLLHELEVRLERGDGADAQRLIANMESRHIKEPGIAQGLFNILFQAGIIDRNGRPTHSAAAEPAGLVTAPEAAEPGRLWTPDSQEPAGKKGALWTPDG